MPDLPTSVALLTTRELAHALAVSESSVKRWADEGALKATRTVGGHRRIPLREAIRFVRDRRLALAHAEVLGLSDVQRLRAQAPPADTIAALQQFLLSGDDVRSRGLLQSLFLSGVSVATILDGPVRAAMAGIGELWLGDPAGVFLEHRATDICVQALQQLRALLPDSPHGPVAVGGGLEGDPYVLGSLSAATLLAAEGYRAVNLGAATPLSTLEEAARRLGARLVWVSVSSPPDGERVPGLLAGLARAVEPLGASVVAGGRHPSVFELPPGRNLHGGRSMGELAAFARGLAAGDAVRKARGA
jgi:excisionase family DNA binding protein